MAPRALLLDVDTGIDDALALAYALAVPGHELVGAVATYGNVTAPEAARNTRHVLDLLGAEGVPVHLGSTHPWGTSGYDALPISREIHGTDGLAGVAPSSDARPLDPVPGVRALAAAAARYGPDLTLVTTGPLTDLATALLQHPEVAASGVRVVAMGGAVHVAGNMTPAAEVNVWHDPAAVRTVLGAGLDLTLVGLDVTMRTLLRRADVDPWRAHGEAGATLGRLVDHYAGVYDRFDPTLGGCGLHDPLAVGVAVDPGLVRTEPLRLAVDEGGDARGRLREVLTGMPEVRVALGVDAAAFRRAFVGRVIDLLTRLPGGRAATIPAHTTPTEQP